MLNQVVQDKINEQINNELYSSYSYLAMSAFCEHKQFTGCAAWLRLQSHDIHVTSGLLFGKITPHACFECSLKAFHDTGFGFRITGGEEMNRLESLS